MLKGDKIRMIRANKKIGIVYCASSEEYVEHLREIIDMKKSEGYCVETIVVDNEIIDSERMLDARVFSNLDKCDCGMVFLTKDMQVEDDKYISRPNVLIELGYLRGRLGKNHIWCITDFPHKEIEEGKYLLPSDFVAEIPEEIDRNNDKADLGRVVERFIRTNNIVKLQNYDTNNLVASLILNPNYRTDYEMLFDKERLEEINKYSLKYQQEEIFEAWIAEKEKLDAAGQIIYLFERMVFLPFFPQNIKCGKLSEFVSVKNNENNEYIHSCQEILKDIVIYEDYKRGRHTYTDPDFYLQNAERILQHFQIFEKRKVAPIIECVAKDYEGLCCLNACLNNVNMPKGDMSSEKWEWYLNEAKECFSRVIELSERNFSNKMEFFRAFAEYNLARTLRCLGEKADLAYQIAISIRKSLAESFDLPEIFKLNFALEKINAELDFYGYAKENGKIDLSVYNEKIGGLSEELEAIRKTPAADVSLFQSLEEKLDFCKKLES